MEWDADEKGERGNTIYTFQRALKGRKKPGSAWPLRATPLQGVRPCWHYTATEKWKFNFEL